jgi:uncharacterized OB-fold protein
MNTPLPGSLPKFHEMGPDAWTAPFWHAALEHRLVVARCESCGQFRLPPTPYCPACLGQVTAFQEVSGEATIFTFSIVRHAVIPELRDHVPYVIAIVELTDAGGARLLTNIVTDDPESLRIGQPVRVAWDDLDEATTVPRFIPT